MAYATVEDVKTLLRAYPGGKIRVAQGDIEEGQDYDVTETEITSIIAKVENGKMKAFINANGIDSADSDNLVALQYASERFVAYEIYRMLYPKVSVNEIPVAVKGWKEDAEETMDNLAQGKKCYGAIGNWEDIPSD